MDENLNSKKSILFNKEDANNRKTITKDTQGNIWVGSTGEGIFIINPENDSVNQLESNKFDNYSLTSTLVLRLFTSDDGSVWVGTSGYGIDKYNLYETSITTLQYNPYNPKSLSNKYIAGVYTDKHLLYAGSDNAIDVFEIETFPPNKKDKIDLSPLKAKKVNSILPSQEGIFAATDNGLVEIINKKKPIHRLKDFVITDLAWLPDGNIIGTTIDETKGLFVYNPTTHEFRNLNLLPHDETIWCVLIEDDFIWVGANKGVYKVAHSLKSYDMILKDGKPYPLQVKSLFRDSKNILWAGTWGNGLYTFDETTNSFNPFELNNQLPNKTIYGVLEDDSTNLWMSSNNGIICYIREKKQLVQFTANQGLQSDEFNTGSYCKTEDGTMIFGGINGVSYFQPQDLLSLNSESKLFFTNVWVDHKRLKKTSWVDEKLILQPHQQNIKLDYTSVSFNASNPTKYRYKIEGQEAYIDNGNLNFINLTNLSAGDYKLLVNYTNPYGNWDEEVASFDFRILTPHWQRPWFIALVVIMLIMIGLIYNDLRIRNYQNANEKLEQAVLERTKQVYAQNSEILAQNEELQAQGNMLTEQNDMLAAQRAELIDFKESLEKKVLDRTIDLNQKNKELLVQNQQLEQFNYITSHNLKGPVSSLKGLLQILPELENEDKIIIDKVRESVQKLDMIINGLAMIIELQHHKEELKAVNVKQTLYQVIDDLKSECEEKNIKLIVEVDDSELYIDGIEAYLYSIIYNLISNSKKYRKITNEDFVKVECYQEDGIAVIKVSDNGIGIEMEYARNKLFRLFQRFHNNHEGKGIGLYMTKIQVESMNGNIGLDSEKGKGTIVTVKIPILNKDTAS